MILLRVIIQCKYPTPVQDVALHILNKNISESKQNLISIVVSVLCHKLKKSKDNRTDFLDYAKKFKCVDPCYLVSASYSITNFANITEMISNNKENEKEDMYPHFGLSAFIIK